MEFRRLSTFALVAAAVGSMGATFRTPNFVVTAPTQQIAEQCGQYAERHRKEKALEWVGKEMPNWGQPCPLLVKVTPGGAGGATTFAFDRGAILSQEMNVEGSLERILHSVLPHEITHTVFAYHFRCPLPRWADEGGSVLSEDDQERRRHDQMVRECLAGGRAFRLRVLFDMKQYPDSGMDVMTLYAQGYSLARFLVESTSRSQYLQFVGDGMRTGWDNAVRTHFQMNRVEELEEAWLTWMRGVFRPDQNLLVKNTKASGAKPSPAAAAATPGRAGSEQAVFRGASPDESSVRPLPPLRSKGGNDGWSPIDVPASGRPRAQLLPPEMDPNWIPPAQRALQNLPK
jgi:hypothetical protein